MHVVLQLVSMSRYVCGCRRCRAVHKQELIDLIEDERHREKQRKVGRSPEAIRIQLQQHQRFVTALFGQQLIGYLMYALYSGGNGCGGGRLFPCTSDHPA
jgi:hypothetical protein